MTRHREGAARRIAAIALVIVGLCCLGWVALTRLESRAFGREQREALAYARAEATATAEPPKLPATLAPHSLIGVLDIPRLGLSEVVVEGDDEKTLRMAIGHLPDTPLPWQPGNSAIAGHRDSQFEPLKGIRAGDRMLLSTPFGDYAYSVVNVSIVLPEDLSVLARTSHRRLTLITCYPFKYIGNAPKRFVIQADAVR